MGNKCPRSEKGWEQSGRETIQEFGDPFINNRKEGIFMMEINKKGFASDNNAGVRIPNAAASLNLNLRDITVDVGVDLLSFGGTKNGMMYGEAVIFFDAASARDFKYLRKQSMQPASKMRFISVQFDALPSNDLFHVWNESTSEVRWMTSFDTTPKEVFDFAERPRLATRA
jgi:threonine aldolase